MLIITSTIEQGGKKEEKKKKATIQTASGFRMPAKRRIHDMTLTDSQVGNYVFVRI